MKTILQRIVLGIFLAFLSADTLMAQTLNLPPRATNALTRSQFINIISPMSSPPDAQRENWVYAQVATGNVPDWWRNLKLITTNAVIGGINHTVSYYVTPDYLAIGSSNDYILMPTTPMLAQRLGSLLGCTLPTRKMVNDISSQAQLKMPPTPMTYNQTNPPVTPYWFDVYNSNIWTQRQSYLPAHPLGSLVDGDKKDVIISTYIYTNLQNGVTTPVVIYGWHYTDGSIIQPLYNGHANYYMDYSHGLRFVQNAITVDGASTTVTAILTNPSLAALLSDETVYSGNVIPQPYYTPGTTAPVIIAHPATVSVKQGTNVAFSVVSVGDLPLTYIWRRNGVTVTSGTNRFLLLTNVQAANAGTYSVVVSNGVGTATSQPAYLVVSTNSFPILFSDNFNADTSTSWNFYWGADDGLADYTTNWAFNYGVTTYTFNSVIYQIPPAPNATDGSTAGLKFTVNNIHASDAGVNIYPTGQSFSGNFALKFDMWVNYPGGAGGAGASGTTQYAIYGLNFLGNEPNWGAASVASTDGIWFGNDGDGGATRDYRAYLGNRSGVQTELIGAASGLTQSNHSASIYTTLLPAPPSETGGTPGKTWAMMELDQTNNVFVLKMNGTIIGQRSNTSAFTSGNMMLGLMDVFSSIASPAADCYVLYDNVRVENLGAAPIVAPGISAQPQSTNLDPGNVASLSVAGTGTLPFAYQWFKDGVLLVGQTNAVLQLGNAQPSDVGNYYAQVSNGAGSALSSAANLVISSNWTLSNPNLVQDQFQFTLLGVTGTNYIIESSTNLIDWTPVSTNAPSVVNVSLPAPGAAYFRAHPAP